MGALTAALEGLGIEVGVYTTKTYWGNVMGDVTGFGTDKHKLWYPHYDSADNMAFAEDNLPFADFTEVYVKQTMGNTVTCGLSQVDSNYMRSKP